MHSPHIILLPPNCFGCSFLGDLAPRARRASERCTCQGVADNTRERATKPRCAYVQSSLWYFLLLRPDPLAESEYQSCTQRLGVTGNRLCTHPIYPPSAAANFHLTQAGSKSRWEVEIWKAFVDGSANVKICCTEKGLCCVLNSHTASQIQQASVETFSYEG
jgi:hypothetical protein